MAAELFPTEYFPLSPAGATPAEVRQWFDERHFQCVRTVKNLTSIASECINMGDLSAARAALGEAKPYMAERDRIEALWVPKR